MTVAALVVSIVALLASAASAWYTRQQAAAAQHTRRIEADRRHDELTPRLTAEHLPRDTSTGRIRPRVQLRPADAPAEALVDDRTSTRVAVVTCGQLPVGQAVSVAVIPAHDIVDGEDRERGGELRLRCTCRAPGHRPWTVFVAVEISGQPWAFWA